MCEVLGKRIVKCAAMLFAATILTCSCGKKPVDVNQYYSECNEIGKDPRLSAKEKVEAIQVKYKSLGDGNRADIQCVVSEKYLNEEQPFTDEGRTNIDYPDHQGFDMTEGKKPRPISRDNPIDDTVDRYGSSRGYFVSGMNNGEPEPFESRSLPYIPNPEAYHVYEVDSARYCDAIDLVRNCDPDNVEDAISAINSMIDAINVEHQDLGLEHVDQDDVKDLLAHYRDYEGYLAQDIPGVTIEDAPYGLTGTTAPWDTPSGERLSEGGADQKWLPLTVGDFEIMGIFKEVQEHDNQ
jgi:hypothetical protein